MKELEIRRYYPEMLVDKGEKINMALPALVRQEGKKCIPIHYENPHLKKYGFSVEYYPGIKRGPV